MSYLAQYADRRSLPVCTARRGVRVDERTLLHRPDFDGGAFVRVFVEDTSGRKLRWRNVPPSPRLRLRIADCVNEIALEFSLESAELRENARFKIDTLIAALERFRFGLEAEAQLYAEREAARASRPVLRQVLRKS